VFLLFFQKRFGDEQWKSRVHVPGLFEPAVQRLLDVLPQSPTVGAHHHAAAHRGVICQFGALDDLVVPF
jgi:hypothetical protein